jgi:hypothetical protein
MYLVIECSDRCYFHFCAFLVLDSLTFRKSRNDRGRIFSRVNVQSIFVASK